MTHARAGPRRARRRAASAGISHSGDAAGDHAGHRERRVQAAELALGQPYDRGRIAASGSVASATIVRTRSAGRARPAPPGCPAGTAAAGRRRQRSTATTAQPVGGQCPHGGGADPARGPGHQRDPSSVTSPAARRSAQRSSAAAASSAVALGGGGAGRVAEHAVRADRADAAAPAAPASASASGAVFAGRRGRTVPGRGPAPAAPRSRSGPRARRRATAATRPARPGPPPAAAGPPRRTGPALPPCADSSSTRPNVAGSAQRPSSTSTSSSRRRPDRQRAGEARRARRSTRTGPPARPARRPAARPAARPARRATSVSVDSGRCGPCCSVEPTGTTSSVRAAPRPPASVRSQLGHAIGIRADGRSRPGSPGPRGIRSLQRRVPEAEQPPSRCRTAGCRARSPRRPGRWPPAPTGRPGRSSPPGRPARPP